MSCKKAAPAAVRTVAPAIPVEEHHPQLVLKLFDGARQRGLLDMQALGGPCEMKLFGQNDKATQVSQFHEQCSYSDADDLLLFAPRYAG
jgi:hypothetical protein